MFKTVRILLLILLFASHSLFAQKAKQVQNDSRAGLLLSYRLALQNADGMAARTVARQQRLAFLEVAGGDGGRRHSRNEGRYS